jgi:hypothetical protein
VAQKLTHHQAQARPDGGARACVIVSVGCVLLRRTKLGTPWGPNPIATLGYINTLKVCDLSNVGLLPLFQIHNTISQSPKTQVFNPFISNQVCSTSTLNATTLSDTFTSFPTIPHLNLKKCFRSF